MPRRTGPAVSTTTTTTAATPTAPADAPIIVGSEGERVERLAGLQSSLHGNAAVQLRRWAEHRQRPGGKEREQEKRFGDFPIDRAQKE